MHRVRLFAAMALVAGITAAPASVLPRAAAGAAASSGLVAWGDNSAGQLGNATLRPSTVPVALSQSGVASISAGGRHDLAVRSDGSVAAWGDDRFGELGDGVFGANNDAESPVVVPGLTDVIAVAAGEQDSLALRSDGTVWAWGANTVGQLGNGTTKASASPVEVAGLHNVTAIAAGAQFCLALLSDGTVMAWGSNDWGQLGDGTTTDRHQPVAVSGLSGVTAIAAGAQHSLAVTSAGSAFSWGDNENDQLGDGQDVSTQSLSAVPVQVSGLTTAVSVAAGEEHSVALLRNGSVWAWGDNGFFQLARSPGFPSGVDSSDVPLVISGVTATAISAGALFTLALAPNGTVNGWGDNAFGQLGNASTGSGPSVVTVKGLTGVTRIAAGGVHGLAVTDSGAGVTAKRSTASATGPSSTVWRVQTTPSPGGSGLIDDVLESVSAASANDAWAVGQTGLGIAGMPLAQHFANGKWTTSAVPRPGSAHSAQLHGVDELAPNDVWAVGDIETSSNEETLIEHWNGSAWKVVPSPNPETNTGSFNVLNAIGGANADDLWAVGQYSDGNQLAAVLFEHWDGTSWSFVSTPVLSDFSGNAVTAISSSDVWMVATNLLAGTTTSAHWNGHQWTQVTTPFLQDGPSLNQMTGLTATSTNNVWASAYESNANDENLDVPYLLHWTGSAWTLVKTPNLGTEGSQLTGVAALSANDVWASGIERQSDGSLLALTEQFNGTSWAPQAVLDPGELADAPDNSLSAIAAPAAGNLFTVGAQEISYHCCLLTLAEATAGG